MNVRFVQIDLGPRLAKQDGTFVCQFNRLKPVLLYDLQYWSLSVSDSVVCLMTQDLIRSSEDIVKKEMQSHVRRFKFQSLKRVWGPQGLFLFVRRSVGEYREKERMGLYSLRLTDTGASHIIASPSSSATSFGKTWSIISSNGLASDFACSIMPALSDAQAEYAFSCSWKITFYASSTRFDSKS